MWRLSGPAFSAFNLELSAHSGPGAGGPRCGLGARHTVDTHGGTSSNTAAGHHSTDVRTDRPSGPPPPALTGRALPAPRPHPGGQGGPQLRPRLRQGGRGSHVSHPELPGAGAPRARASLGARGGTRRGGTAGRAGRAGPDAGRRARAGAPRSRPAGGRALAGGGPAGRAPPPELGRAIPMMPSHRARLPERGRR